MVEMPRTTTARSPNCPRLQSLAANVVRLCSFIAAAADCLAHVRPFLDGRRLLLGNAVDTAAPPCEEFARVDTDHAASGVGVGENAECFLVHGGR